MFGRTAALALFALAACAPDPPRKPNLVIVALDTLRPDHLGCYGYARDTSPNLDAFAEEAVVFDNAQAAAPWTAPSLLSLMTSLQPSVHGVFRFPNPGEMSKRVTTLAEVLKENGYRTAAFTDGGYAKPQFGLKQGFDEYPLNPGDLLDKHDSNLAHPSRIRSNVDRTLKWLEQTGDEPFFLFFHTYEIHGPYHAPEEYVQRFRPDYDEEAEHEQLEQVFRRWVEQHELDAGGLRLVNAHVEHCGTAQREEAAGMGAQARVLGVASLEPERMQFYRDQYDAEIRHTDYELKRLLDFLDAPALREDTLIVFVSDHGEGFGEHGVSGHGNVLHEEDLRVLLMLRAPGVAPRRVTDVVRSIDAMPTVLDLLGVERAKLQLQGRSLVPLARGATLAPEPSFSHALSKQGGEERLWSVREGSWRYVWNEETHSGALFDLASDPGELTDVAASNPKVAERLDGLLNAQRDLDQLFRERASGPVTDYEQDEQTLRELRRLGYIDAETPADEPPPDKPARGK